MKGQLAVERMSVRQLWGRAFVLLDRARPLVNQGPHDLEVSLEQLKAVLQEIQLRGEQLSLLPEPERWPHIEAS